MKGQQLSYQKSFLLIIVFLVLITVSLVVALYLSYNLTERYVQSEFASQKINVLEETLKPYNDFFQNKVPEVSNYQGFLDSVTATKYADTIFRKYSFVEGIDFYDIQISNHPTTGVHSNNLSVDLNASIQFERNAPKDSLFKITSLTKSTGEFNKITSKFLGYVETSDTTKSITNDVVFNYFYAISPQRITYMSIPGREELKIFKSLMFEKRTVLSPFYDEDILTYYLNPLKLQITSTHPELYENISIRPIAYESLDDEETVNTDIPFSGALADYKLYFSSSTLFLKKETNRQFLPVAGTLLLVYGVLTLIAYLIYGNLNINSRMFKLQYDFINNLTHEFKTPVSVIKIAGNNIRSASKISDKERMHYGKILDEEADKLNNLMNKLLSFTQIENRSIQIKAEAVEMDSFVENIISSYKLKYPTFKITLHINGVEVFVTDPVLLGSIFDNLIENAYKYSEIDRKELEILIKRDGEKITFRFIDKGIGIAEEEIDNIFKKFYRIQTQYNQQGSVGLGLAFCKELVNFMDGDIIVKSYPGRGSEFKIILPFAQ